MYIFLERKWIDIEPGAQFDQAHPVAERLTPLFFGTENYIEKKMGRSNSGECKMIFGTCLSTLNIGLMKYGKSKMAGGGGNKKRFQYCTDPSGQEILYLRALQGHSGRDPIDPILKDNVLIPNDFFEYIYHIECAVNLHSITNSGMIAGGQNFRRDRQTVFFYSR